MRVVRVTELKQWAYCPRVVYYHQVMPGLGKPTYKMEAATRAQELIERLEVRRGLGAYGLDVAQRRFGLWLSNEELGLSGKLDLVLEMEDSAAVVDFKLTSGEPGQNHRMQLTGYAMLVEAELRKPVQRCFIYRIPDNHVFEIDINERMRSTVCNALRQIREIRDSAVYPPATELRARCAECEYANYCGDIW